MNWVIEQLWVKPVDGSFTNVVVTAAWRCNGVQGQYSGTCYGTASFEAPDAADFVEYSNLTQDQVLNWVWAAGIDKAATEASVQKQIADQANPPVIVPPLPWNSAA